MKLVNNPNKLIGTDGVDLKMTNEQFQSFMNKKNDEKTGAIKESFKKFVDSPVPDLSNFSFPDTNVVVEIFVHEEVGSMLGSDGKNMIERHVFPVCKVIATGPNSVHKVGTYVKLKDYEASEIQNPAYEIWTKNNMEGGSLKKVGEAPPPVVSNFYVIHGKKCFNVDPIKAKTDFGALTYYVMYEPNIECVINDPLKLI